MLLPRPFVVAARAGYGIPSPVAAAGCSLDGRNVVAVATAWPAWIRVFCCESGCCGSDRESPLVDAALLDTEIRFCCSHTLASAFKDSSSPLDIVVP